MTVADPGARHPGALRALLWLAALAAAAVALRAAATGDLAAPPPSPGALLDWIDAREPAAALVALVRVAGEVAAWYLLACSALELLGRVARVPGATRLAGALAVPGVRRVVHAGLGLGLAAGALGTVGAADAERAGPAPVTMIRTPPAAVTQVRVDGRAAMVPTTGASTGTATMRPADVDSTDRHAATPPAPPAPPPTPAPTTWRVRPGDSLWRVAEEVLADAWGRVPSDAEVDPYWRLLVAANRGRLVDPDDADLVLPGQVLDVPAPPSAAG